MSHRNPMFSPDRRSSNGHRAKNKDLPIWKKTYLKIAKELGYSNDTLKALELCKNDTQADAIMTQARSNASMKGW